MDIDESRNLYQSASYDSITLGASHVHVNEARELKLIRKATNAISKLPVVFGRKRLEKETHA